MGEIIDCTATDKKIQTNFSQFQPTQTDFNLDSFDWLIALTAQPGIGPTC